ncbi:hypothetical protein PPS11_07850 [Pseudomonas putida S11]|nr:hypothetical protein PPS11_07850 [Pseudomonas putida S11]
MNFFLCGLPSALFTYQSIFTTESLASEPELVKKTWFRSPGASSASLAASAAAGALVLWLKLW